MTHPLAALQIRAVFLASLLLAWVTLAGAGPVETRTRKETAVIYRDTRSDDAWTRVEVLRKWLEEWGSVTASAPIVMHELGQFNLEREFTTAASPDKVKTRFKSTQEHIDEASKAVSGRAIQSTSQGFGNSLNLEVTPQLRLGATPSTGGTPAPAVSPSPLPSPPGDNELTPPQFSLLGDIKTSASAASPFPSADLSLTSQQSILMGTNSKITELLMRTMADPPKRDFTNPGKSVHMAIVQVSCNPGWRTRENYVADITASCEYYDSLTLTSAPEAEGRRPVVFSVLPLIDAQTLELQNSQRQIVELIAQISAAFPTKAANFRAKDLMQFVRDYKSTISTKTPRTISNSYSSGNTFGFRFTPSLVALKDPAERRSPSANILQSTVLPVLVTIVVDQGALQGKYDSVMVHISNRWLLNDRPPLRQFWKRWGRPMRRETTARREELALQSSEAGQTVSGIFGDSTVRHPISSTTSEEALLLRRDLAELSAKVLGSSHVVFAFKELGNRNSPGHPVIRDVQPRAIPVAHTTRLAIWGNFFTPESEVSVNGVAGTDKQVSLDGRQLLCTVRVPAETIEGSGDATVIVESNGTFDTFGVRLWKPSPPP